MSSRLLPLNATDLERGLADVMVRDLPVPLRDLMDPARCPVELLPYLAWAFSVDRWDTNWSEAAKRAAIKAAYYVHAHKGTIGALRRVVEPFGFRIKVREWWQINPVGEPGTFALDITVTGQTVTDETYELLDLLISDAKPVSRHLAQLYLMGEVAGDVVLGLAAYDGDITTVYPYSPSLIQSQAEICLGATTYEGDITTVYPPFVPHLTSKAPILIGAALHIIDNTTIYPVQD